MFSIPFRCVCDLKSQDQLVDSKMMVESKVVAVVTLLMVWQRIESSQSQTYQLSRFGRETHAFLALIIRAHINITLQPKPSVRRPR